MTSISHALLVDPDEAEALLVGRGGVVLRSRPTQLRMRVGVLRKDGALLATARLVDSSRPDDRSTASEWTLHDLETLLSPILVGAGGGPLWRRLRSTDREMVAGRPTADAPGGAELESESATVRPSEQRADHGRDALEPATSAFEEEGLEEVYEEAMRGSADGGEEVSAEDAAPETFAVEATIEEAAPSGAGTSATADRDVDDARNRALAFVPAGMIDVDEAHRLLIKLRDVEIKRFFPDVRPEHGILRRTMLQTLLDTGVASREEYDELIPADLKRMTDRRQVEVYLNPVIEILARVA